ncbi:hypothetical protein X949_5186 [Burkholderia pseudomallei MSHR5609]|nr:hypothetical protein X949_5186 [Burkholderia pseudomallei MSHR5609]
MSCRAFCFLTHELTIKWVIAMARPVVALLATPYRFFVRPVDLRLKSLVAPGQSLGTDALRYTR